MKKTIFAFLGMGIMLFSCKKNNTDPVTPVADKPFSNTNAGTNWTFDVITFGTAGDTTLAVIDTARVLSGDTTIATGTSDQRTYKIISHTNGGHTYLNLTGNDYYQFQEVANLGTQVQALYLKDNLSVNDTWTQNIPVLIPSTPPLPSIPITLTLTNKIIEKGVSKVVNGITYNDVVTVQSNLTAPGLTIVSTIANYYARNIGLIEGDYDIDVSGITSLHTKTLVRTADIH